uniref:SURF1 family cytochrome oxidase biogenesis protein n=1 Tax=Candidatus Planktophila sp. TaxID=2175601 RepID=UPI0040493F71
MTQKSSFLTKVGQTVAVLLITALFVSLGFWQLQRAADLKESLQVATAIDTNIVPLESITSPRQAIPPSALNRTVSITGKYIANFKAANQKDGKEDIQDWESALLQVGDRSAILVVRGLWSERLLNSDIEQSMDIQVEGLLVASQDGDRARNAPGEISRLDSAVVTSLTDLDLFDGYVVATSEVTRDQLLERTRVVPEKLKSRISGFYWQHLSYVVIWWLMAAVVVFLPFYRRRVST